MMNRSDVLDALRGGLIVSCQAHAGEPLYATGMMPYMARAALAGGACAIRCHGEDIQTVRREVSVPIIGINKRSMIDSEVFITPQLQDVALVNNSGADVVAFDATMRHRPNGEQLGTFIQAIREAFPNLLLMADISTLDEGVAAASLGADIVATTLAGYTSYTACVQLPDIALISALKKTISVPIIAEGGVSTPEQAAKCLRAGAWAVTVGGAITRPHEITRRFVNAMREEHAP